MNILIVDDNNDDRTMLRCVLQAHGHEVMEAVNGEHGLQSASSHRLDLIVSDALMPVMDGFQFLRTLRKTSSVPFVFYSAAYDGSREMQLAASMGANGYLLKPKDPLELIEEIERIAGEEPKERPAGVEENQFLEKYCQVVTSKLEEKVRELEETLAERKRDITSLRKSEAHLQHAQKMECIGALAGGVAHDFNNILSVISGYSELLLHTLKGDELNYAREISDSVIRGAELTRTLLAFSGKHEQENQYDDLNQIVVNLRKSMSRLLQSDITLTFGLCDDRLPVFVDRIQIEQVLINLLVNARDSLTSGGMIDLTTRLVEIHEEVVTGGAPVPPGNYGLLTVTDNGTGMDADTIGRIFEPFFTTKESGKGTGLGLAIAFGIVSHHNGHISVASTPGKGSVFGIYLPIFKGTLLPKYDPEPESAKLHGTETVLFVDDEPSVLQMTGKLLAQYGYTVLTAADGVDALEVFEAHRNEIRVVIIDLIMPRMNGRTTIELIRQRRPKLPVILTSGYSKDIFDLDALDGPGVIFMQKPVRPQKLAAAIRVALEGDLDRPKNDEMFPT